MVGPDVAGESLPADSPAGIREVYGLVDDVRQDLGGRLDALTERIDSVVINQEHRLTAAETTLVEHGARLARVEAGLKVHDDRLTADEAAQQALTKAATRQLSNRQWAVLAALTAVMALAAVLALVIR